MLRKIALSGMKGRKKDTFLLIFVVILAFIFIVIATTLHSSSEITKLQQRTEMFGHWKASYLNGNQEIENQLKVIDEINSLGISRIVGQSSRFGTIGTFNKDLLEMGSFEIYEGRMPENENEIAIELNQLSYFPSDVKIGDKFPVTMKETLYKMDNQLAWEEQMERLDEDITNRVKDWYGYEDLGELERKNPEAYRGFWWGVDQNVRNEHSLESFGGTKIVVKTSYLYAFLRGLEEIESVDLQDNVDRVLEHGTMIGIEATVTRDMEITGIIQTYSNQWDVGENPIANSFITEEGGRALLDNGFLLTEEADLSEFVVPVNYFIGTNTSPETFYSNYKDKFGELRRNTYAYPETIASTETTLTYTILAFIFMATIFAVFQIYLTQMKRRIRKIALLKSIGSTNGQIAIILLWEVIYLLAISVPIGILGGLGLTKSVIYIMNNYGNGNLGFYINNNLLLLGLLSGIIAVFIGMIIPLIKALKVPLTGSISKPPKHKKNLFKIKLKLKPVNVNMKLQSFWRVSLRNIRYNKGKYLLTAGLYTITITVLLGSIFLSFLFFQDYINDVIVTNKPSYGLELDYGMRTREIPEFEEEFRSIEGVSNVHIYKAGEHAYLWYEGIKNNELVNGFKEVLHPYLLDEHFGDQRDEYVNIDEENDYLVKDSIVSNVYGIDSEGPLYERFKNSIKVGNLNQEKFHKGEEVILMLPLYNKGNSNHKHMDPININIARNADQKNRMNQLFSYSNNYDITYDFRYAHSYNTGQSIMPGEKIHLTIPTEDIVNEMKTNDVRFHDLTVSGILHYFPEEGIWPFSATVENPTIIGSYNLISELYPASISGIGDMSLEELRGRQALMPTRYGKTWIYLDSDKKADEVKLVVDLQRITREKGFKLHNYIKSNKRVYGKAFNFAAIIALLGISVAIITLIILYNTSLSNLEQERERIGIFQSIGVTAGQFKRLYFITGLAYGAIAILAAHIILSIILLITTFSYKGSNPLWLYPWKVHIASCIVFFIIAVLTYYLPIRKIVKNQPVNNIRSLSR